MGRTRFLESLVDSVRGGRRVKSVLRTEMAVSSILPGKGDVTKGAHLGPIQRQACIALVSIGFQVSGKALRLHRLAAWKQNYFVDVIGFARLALL